MCVKGPNETPRHLHITNFGALNNLLQKELLIRALYTHLIEEGGEESGKETKSAQIKKLRDVLQERKGASFEQF